MLQVVPFAKDQQAQDTGLAKQADKGVAERQFADRQKRSDPIRMRDRDIDLKPVDQDFQQKSLQEIYSQCRRADPAKSPTPFMVSDRPPK